MKNALKNIVSHPVGELRMIAEGSEKLVLINGVAEDLANAVKVSLFFMNYVRKRYVGMYEECVFSLETR